MSDFFMVTYFWSFHRMDEYTRHLMTVGERSGGKEEEERERREDSNDSFLINIPQCMGSILVLIPFENNNDLYLKILLLFGN